MYTNYYQLHRKPFENAPDPDILFLSNQHREVLYSLLYGIEEAKGFILLAGEVGTGKTTLVHALLEAIDSKHVVVNVVNPHVGFADIFNLLLKKLALPETERLSLAAQETLKEKLEELAVQDRRAVLLIDEAHLLSEESLQEIRLLSNIENPDQKLIQIVLVGQNEVYDLLNKPSLRSLKQRIVVNRQLKPLDWHETPGYIAHRLSVSGRAAELFDRQAIAMVWRAGGGIPRLINQLCDNALMTGYALEAKIIGRKIIREVVDDMGRMRSWQWLQFLRQPVALWFPGAIAVVCLLIFTGLGITGWCMLLKENTALPAQVSLLAAPQSLSVDYTLHGSNMIFPAIARASMIKKGADGKLHIHYASFYDPVAAQRASATLQKAGFNASLVSLRQGESEVFRVYIGTFNQQEEAVAMLNMMDFNKLTLWNGAETETGNYAN